LDLWLQRAPLPAIKEKKSAAVLERKANTRSIPIANAFYSDHDRQEWLLILILLAKPKGKVDR
jgi:hypothetical protein